MRIRMAAAATVVVMGLSMPSLAHAMCGQIYTDGGYEDSYGFAWGQVDTWFASENHYYFSEWASCGEAVYYLQGWAEYAAEIWVHGPSTSASDSHTWNAWWAHAYAQVWINQGGFGEYSIDGSGEEYLCINDEPVNPCPPAIYSSLVEPAFPVSVPFPDVELSASDYAPLLDSGAVQVSAQIDPYWASPGPIQWDGCQPDGSHNGFCWFQPPELGPHTVSASYPGGGDDQVVIDVQQPPPPLLELKLYLDAAPFSFQQPGDDDLPEYLPGSNPNGTSVAVPSCEVGPGPPACPLQTVRLVAAFVDGSGQIVTPPPGATQATFGLSNPSAHKGYAMNAGSSEAPDFELVSTMAGFTGSPPLAYVELRVYDYGGETNASVEAGEFEVDPTIRIPVEHPQAPRLPQAGWTASQIVNGQLQTVPVPGVGTPGQGCPSGSVSGPAEDCDTGPGANTHFGDGLERYEEYRGFVIQGQHRRLNPQRKDLFVFSEVPEAIGGDGSLASAASALSALPTPMSAWRITFNEMLMSRRADFNQVLGFGPQYLQDALSLIHITDQPTRVSPTTYGQTVRAPAGQTEWRGPRRVIQAMEIYTFNVRLSSPPTPSGTVNDAADAPARRRFIAHEIGHGIEMEDEGTCTASNSIMNEGPPPTTNTSHQCWNNMPTTYDATNIGRLQLRSW